MLDRIEECTFGGARPLYTGESAEAFASCSLHQLVMCACHAGVDRCLYPKYEMSSGSPGDMNVYASKTPPVSSVGLNL